MVAIAVAVFTELSTEIVAVITGFVSKSNKLGSTTVNSPVLAFIFNAPVWCLRCYTKS